MPDPDGYAVLAEMRADRSLSHVPVIVTSGLDDCLDKLLDPALLPVRVEVALTRARIRQPAP